MRIPLLLLLVTSTGAIARALMRWRRLPSPRALVRDERQWDGKPVLSKTFSSSEAILLAPHSFRFPFTEREDAEAISLNRR